ncbi:MAG: ergothioneine biosynthesis protein EgtB [Acidobacteriota bacterium]
MSTPFSRYIEARTAGQAMSETRADHLSRYREIRQATRALCETLSSEDCAAQSMTDCSPTKWHLAHTSWFFETFILESALPDYAHFNPQFRILFNSYYQAVGDQYARPQRGLLSRPSLAEVFDYRQHVDRCMTSVIEDEKLFTPAVTDVLEIGLHHEQQHQELILTDIKHLFSFNPLRPRYRPRSALQPSKTEPLRWHNFTEGLKWIGHEGAGFAFDNEQPRHRVFVHPFEMASRLATNGEYISFIEDGGYRRPELWLSDGWYAVKDFGWSAPLYWEREGDRWFAHTLSGRRELNTNEPVCHVSYYEADAFARWRGARLATEMEWETAAEGVKIEGNFVEDGLLHPAPQQKATDRPAQLFGDVWEWTASPYIPYPGYHLPSGAIGEYNGKFMCNQMVLRGGSCATPRSHIRASYRNFFPPTARWQFSGIRLTRDV